MSERPRTDTIRIAPIRRSTITPDAWGFHSVPSMLSDFQRHTSHGNIGDINRSESNKRIWSQADLGESPEDISRADRIVMLLSYVALPTALLSISHISMFDPCAALYILGCCLFTGLIVTQISLEHLLIGITCAIYSVIVLDSDGARNTAIISTLASLRLKLDFFSYEGLMNLESIWLLVVIGGVSLSTATWKLSFVAFVLLTGLSWSRLSEPYSMRKRSSKKTTIGYVIAALVIVTAFITTAQFNWMILLSCGIASCSLAMFFVVSDSIVPSRYDSVVCGLLSATVEAIVQSRFEWRQVAEVLLLLPSLTFKRSEMDDLENDLKTRKRTLGDNVASHIPGAWSVLDSILAHDDTRSIFYFFCLNFSFMLVQLLYSLLSHSLGLLSDSIHMFFDCLALLVGLVASILAKFPPSSRFPYGLHMVETVSGFANGCLLLAISVGVLFEAFERITNPVKLEKLTELVVVSTLGLVVNFVGIFAFNHAHSHGGAPCSHSSSHTHEHKHSHNHDHGHDHHDHHDHHHDHDDGHDHSCHTGEDEGEECHGSDNMHGIFLHIVADTLGSVGVIISTLLLAWTGWHGWDAVASIVISILIFASAVPLVRSSARTLLLGLKENDEYCLRNILNDIYNLEGVASYSVPKFWNDGQGIRGTIHVQYQKFYNETRVRDKVRAIISSGGIDNVTIQMEEEGSACWCNPKKN